MFSSHDLEDLCTNDNLSTILSPLSPDIMTLLDNLDENLNTSWEIKEVQQDEL